MAMTVVLNNETFPLRYYNKNTSLVDGKIVSAAYITFGDGVVTDDLTGLLQNGIQSMEIDNDGEAIYTKTGMNATIESIQENLNEGKIQVQINVRIS